MLATEGIRVRPFLYLVFAETVGFKSSAAESAGLVDHTAERGNEDLASPMEDQRGLGERDSGIVAQRCVNGQEQRELFLHANRERIDAARRGPGRFAFVLESEHDVALLGQRAGAGDVDRQL